jgi:heme exporter protein D
MLQAPPNGGCDPLTSCTAEGDSIICGACPAGYFGQGDAACHDIDECHVVPNGGCDPQTTCVNTAGGYECSACPPRFSGDGYTGCISENTISNFVSMGHHGDPSWSALTLTVLAVLIAGITYAIVRLCNKKDVDMGRAVEKVDVSGVSIYDSSWAR